MAFSADVTVVPGNQGAGLPYSWNPSIFSKNASGARPGSPEWWLFNGITAIEGKQTDHKIREDYVSGCHPLPNGDPRYVKALRDFQEKALTNYISLATNAIVPRMRVKGFRFGRPEAPKVDPGPSTPPAGGGPQNGSQAPQKAPQKSPSDRSSGIADPDARNVWMANDMDFQMEGFLSNCATYGEGYLLVGPEDPETSEPTITQEHPRLCHVFPDPVRPTRALAGIRLWKDIYLGRVIAVLYLPDRIYAFSGPANSETISASVALANGAFKPMSIQTNDLGEVPLVRCQWRPDGKAEAEDSFPIQDRINLTILNRLVISKSQAYRQRWMTGGQIAQGAKKGKKGIDEKPPFDPGADTLWHVPAPDAKFGDFDQVDITQILNSVRDDVIDLAALQQLPAHYLMGRMANISGDTLTQAESGHKLRTQARQRSVGWALEKAMRLVFKYKGDEKKAKELDAEVIWGDAEIRSLAEKADASVKFAQAFAAAPPFMVPILAEMMDLDPDQIEQLVVDAQAWQQEQQAREDQMMQQQADTQMALAKEGAKAKVGANQPSKGK